MGRAPLPATAVAVAVAAADADLSEAPYYAFRMIGCEKADAANQTLHVLGGEKTSETAQDARYSSIPMVKDDLLSEMARRAR